MERLNSIKEFEKFQERAIAERSRGIPTIVISAGTCGVASGAGDLVQLCIGQLLKKKLTKRINLRVTGCHGFCQMEPSVLIEPKGTFYPKVNSGGMIRIVEAVAENTVLQDLLYEDPETGERIESENEIPFYRKQLRAILARNREVDPIRIYSYVETGGYSALSKTLSLAKPEWVIEEVKSSRLRGRGGAGFSTGLKWELLAKRSGDKGKFVVCNADEGDPGAYMDRSIIEGNPHSVIEGMIIGAYATQATEGIIYVRNEYPMAIKHLMVAIRQARELGFLGKDILGTDFSFDIELVKGAGAFVCGEETALIQSIEGKIGEPRQRPAFPVEKGIRNKPTAINNVETWANIPLIIGKGASEYVKLGSESSTGTKIFSVVGKILNTGLVEVPMGITLKEIVYEIGGGPVDGSKIKAVQTGGPSGGCIPESMFDMRVDFESLAKAGCIMGSGGMIVMDETTCMVDVAKYFMNFMRDESCGKCFVCRKGTQRMGEILDDISKGRASLQQLDLLEELATTVKDTSLCGLGQSAANPVLSTLKYFREEYESHILQKKCPAFICKDLVGAPCQTACPMGTEAWRYVALLARGEMERAYQVIRETNPLPSVCARVCDRKCESRCSQTLTGGQAIAIRALKRFVTDNVHPSVYRPLQPEEPARDQRVAVVGAGPAGLAAAHYLSLQGYKVTVFESESEPGGMLAGGIPPYRLRRDVLSREIRSLVNDRINIRCGVRFGRDFTIDQIFEDGYWAIFLSIGAHKSLRLNLDNEDLSGVYPAVQFLKASNLKGMQLARGRVGVIGGGNSAVDAARAALRQDRVESVTILYRRTREEMPAFEEEIEAALQEGIGLEPLVTPVRIRSEDGCLKEVQFCRNRLGAVDEGGRKRPLAVPGTEFTLPFDTLIIAVGERPDTDAVSSMGIEVNERGAISVDPETCTTSRRGVFAGGDVAGGFNTVVDAMAAGKRGAMMIGRFLRGEEMKQPRASGLPRIYVEPCTLPESEMSESQRAEPPTLNPAMRVKNHSEVELPLPAEAAIREARRCLRCDLHFTQQDKSRLVPAVEGDNV